MTHVTLRAVVEADRERLLAWRNSPEVAAFMYSDHRITPDEHDRWFDGIAGDPTRTYWIIEADGLPVGLANIVDINRQHGRCAWAYYLADPAVRGLGVGSFVEYWVLEHVFGVLGLQKLWCEVLETNEAVWRLHERYGFRREALFRRHVVKAGAPTDVVGLGILADEWRARRDEMADRLRAKGYAV
ncbi:MAG TPA: UDP-4-amino-4,6-dideoxy-N-acetyl-beta-L-altrosamine N-acetyltransferase [Caulobacter sp.]|nr:UDP-4-amino-4,6-dideoxy-N-acetyl-beta-L-altrosamine N-acetyltransferase [Caulobacter sp.]